MSLQADGLFIVPDDILDMMLSFLHTSDLARLELIMSIPDKVWTQAIRRRCGEHWPGGKYGVIRLFVATHALPQRKVMAQSQSGVRVWRDGVGFLNCNVGHASCMTMYGEDHIIVGNEYGLMLYPENAQLWALAGVTSVACLEDYSVWFCTTDQRGYCYRLGTITELPCSLVLCVSGPQGLAGTATGTYPVQTLPMPCCRIVQSSVLACAWFADGHVCTIRNHTLLHVFQTGMIAPTGFISVIGDVVCVGGRTWRDGKLHGYSCDGERVCTADGKHALVRLPCGGVGAT